MDERPPRLHVRVEFLVAGLRVVRKPALKLIFNRPIGDRAERHVVAIEIPRQFAHPKPIGLGSVVIVGSGPKRRNPATFAPIRTRPFGHVVVAPRPVDVGHAVHQSVAFCAGGHRLAEIVSRDNDGRLF